MASGNTITLSNGLPHGTLTLNLPFEIVDRTLIAGNPQYDFHVRLPGKGGDLLIEPDDGYDGPEVLAGKDYVDTVQEALKTLADAFNVSIPGAIHAGQET